MVPYFTLPAAHKQAYKDCVDTLINTVGKRCKLVYPSVMIECTICTAGNHPENPGRLPPHHWRGGGPIPFPHGAGCPNCNGIGKYKAAETTEVVTFMCDFNPSSEVLKNVGPELRTPGGIAEITGYAPDLAKVKRAERVILALDLEPYCRYTFTLIGEPYPLEEYIGDRWLSALMRRAG